MEALWKLELEINSMIDGSTISKLPEEYLVDRQSAEGRVTTVSGSLSKDEFVTGNLSHPTYGNFYLDPSMWGTILNARKWSF
jgi:hypothetical protein